MLKKVAIVGCGASGLICAIVCARNGIKVDLYEQNGTCGKKILVSGNGKCNIANVSLKKEDFFTVCDEIVEVVLRDFGYEKIKKFFVEFGIVFVEQTDGRVFPLSQEAKSVVEVLVTSAVGYGVKIFTSTKVEEVFDDLSIVVNEQKKVYDAVVLATGSKAAKHLGSNESGYEIAKKLSHNVTRLYPALVQLVTVQKSPKLMSGVRLECEASLYINGVKEEALSGDVLFADYGLSGLAILDLSLLASKALDEGNAVDIELNLLKSFAPNKLSHHLIELSKRHPHYSVFTLLHTLLPKKVVLALLKELHIDSEMNKIDTKLVKRIVYKIQKWRFAIEDTKGFRYAEVCGGGVDSGEIDPKTFESKKLKNLYIIGEVLDVVGKRGGYNFAFAWGSGYLAGCDIIRKVNKKG